MEQWLDGRLMSVFLDEGWQYLRNHYWQNRLAEWLPTLRKKNSHIILATQSPKSVLESPISSMLLDNAPTNIYFTNPQAKREHYIDGFSLSEAEFRCVKENDPKTRLFLYKQRLESALCRLNLGHLDDALAVISGNAATVNIADQVRAEVGDDPRVWVPLFHKRRKEC